MTAGSVHKQTVCRMDATAKLQGCIDGVFATESTCCHT